MEVVVPNVVRRHLVVPEQPPGARVEHEERVGVQHGPGKDPAVRPLRRTAPRPGVRVARVEPTLRVDRDRIPCPTTACLERKLPRLLDRHELPAHCARLGVERVDRTSSRRWEAESADEHEALPHHRRDGNELLARTRQVPPPPLLARVGVQAERIRVGRAVDAVARDDEPVRAVVRRVVAPRPPERAARPVEREDVAPQVLYIDGVGVGDGGRGEDAREGRPRREREAPTLPQARDVACVDRRTGSRARALEIAVRQLPDRLVAAPAARAEQAREQRRGCRQRSDP